MEYALKEVAFGISANLKSRMVIRENRMPRAQLCPRPAQRIFVYRKGKISEWNIDPARLPRVPASKGMAAAATPRETTTNSDSTSASESLHSGNVAQFTVVAR